MTDDRLDTALRTLVADVVATAPAPPTWESIAARLEAPPAAGRAGVLADPVTEGPVGRDVPIDQLPSYTPRDPDRPDWWKRIIGGFGALGLVLGGGYAVSWLASDDGGGADTPEAAVTEFVDALTAEDLLGVLDALPPSERVVLRESAEDLAAEAERLGLARDLDLRDVAGVEVELQDMTLTADPLGEDVVAVYVDGTLVSRATGAELPLGPALLDSLSPGALDDFGAGVASLEETFADDNVFVVAVREGDGWHVSTWYTIAEYLRRGQEKGDPTFGVSPVAPTGADSPEAVAAALFERGAESDLPGALSLALPGESRVLYDYAPLWFADAAEARRNFPVDVTVDRLDTTVEGDGSVRTVHIGGYAATVVTPEETLTIEFDGECSRWESTNPASTPAEDTWCRADALAEGTTDAMWTAGTTADLVVVEQDGRWYLSPVRTATASILGGTAALADPAAAADALESGGLYLFFPGRLLGLAGPYGWGGGPLVLSRTVTLESTGTPIDPVTGTPIDPVTGEPIPMDTAVPTTVVGSGDPVETEFGPATIVAEPAPAPPASTPTTAPG